MKFTVLGTSEFTLCCLKALLNAGQEISSIFSMPKSISPNNSVDITSFAKQNKIIYYEVKDINSSKTLRLLSMHFPDYILVSWPKILKKEVLKIPKYFCIGTHPTALPFNRGRHPLQWIIALGVKKNKLSFFKINKGIDSGNILQQIPILITSNDSINNLNDKINKAAYQGIRNLCKKFLLNPFYNGRKQNQTLANYWRKRTPHDITLDLRMSSVAIQRTVRSFTYPYNCVNLIFENHIIKIVKVSLVSKEKKRLEQIQRIEIGKIISIKKNIIRIKIEDGIIDLHCSDSRKIPAKLFKVRYIHPPSKYIMKWSDKLKTKLL